MSNFNSWWYKLVDKKQDLAEPTATVTITSEQLKKLLKSAYCAGSKDMAALAEELKKHGTETRTRNARDFMSRLGL